MIREYREEDAGAMRSCIEELQEFERRKTIRFSPLTRSRSMRSTRERFEYKFVRVGEGWMGARKAAEREYQSIIQQHARDVWRLVQIFAPAMGAYGAAKYYEIILEKEV